MQRALYLAGHCGIYCGLCEKFDSSCPGCSMMFHPDCQFIQCCEEKDIDHCGLCNEFPCKRLQDFVPDDDPKKNRGYHIENLRLRAKLGTEEWLETQKKLSKQS